MFSFFVAVIWLPWGMWIRGPAEHNNMNLTSLIKTPISLFMFSSLVTSASYNQGHYHGLNHHFEGHIIESRGMPLVRTTHRANDRSGNYLILGLIFTRIMEAVWVVVFSRGIFHQLMPENSVFEWPHWKNIDCKKKFTKKITSGNLQWVP